MYRPRAWGAGPSWKCGDAWLRCPAFEAAVKVWVHRRVATQRSFCSSGFWVCISVLPFLHSTSVNGNKVVAVTSQVKLSPSCDAVMLYL